MDPHHSDTDVTLYAGDCLDVLRTLPDASVDAVVTDPPYGLEFMGREWDSFKPSNARLRTRVDGRTNPAEGKSTVTTPEAYAAGLPFQQWCQAWAAECLRVLKPGGHLLAFGGTRTVHRLTCGIEDAGFEVRDGIDWLYGQGFPKSLDVSKAIDRTRDDRADTNRVTGWLAGQRDRAGLTNRDIDAAFGFNGMAGHWTAAPHLKIAAVPTWEQWEKLRALLGFSNIMDAEVWRLNGRKGEPGDTWRTAEIVGIDERWNEPSGVVNVGQGERTRVERQIKAANSTAAQQWQGWGTALKPAREPIVAARKPLTGTVAVNVQAYGTGALNIDATRIGGPNGRWPTNVVLSHAGNDVDGDLCADGCVPGCPVAELDAQSGTLTSGANPTRRGSDGFRDAYGDFKGQAECTPARGTDSGGASRFFPVFRYEAKADAAERPKVNGTAHPTVKPLDLMRWLVQLVTPPGGTVLEPFAGSGTTIEACLVEGFRCVAVEREAAYLPLIMARISKPIEATLFGDAA